MERCLALRNLIRNVNKSLKSQKRSYSSNNQEGDKSSNHLHNSSINNELSQNELNTSNSNLPPIPDPNLCCGEGCANCIWILYAEELNKHLKDKKKVITQIDKQIDDPSIKAFIIMQINDSFDRD